MKSFNYASILGHTHRTAMLLALALTGATTTQAAQVPEWAARTVAQHFMSDRGALSSACDRRILYWSKA
ncbi:MAG: hypothetical protein IPK99_05315 [Flavobacteriales bacterium]|nr:hypothetical protein [Flavobacteriales bacterium]